METGMMIRAFPENDDDNRAADRQECGGGDCHEERMRSCQRHRYVLCFFRERQQKPGCPSRFVRRTVHGKREGCLSESAILETPG